MKHFLVVALFASALAVTAPADAKAVKIGTAVSAPLISPAGKTFTEATVREAIIAGGAMRGWLLESEAPGRIVLRNVIRGKHTVVVAAVYTADSLKVEYVSSENLNYKLRDGQAYIHPKYHQWVDTMTHDIRLKLQAY